MQVDTLVESALVWMSIGMFEALSEVDCVPHGRWKP